MPASSRPSRKVLEGTSFHETIPDITCKSRSRRSVKRAHPITRYLFSSGFGEGWALYAERLAGEMGAVLERLLQIGDLGEQALRAARLVVDLGSPCSAVRQQAIDYMVAHGSRVAHGPRIKRWTATSRTRASHSLYDGRLEIGAAAEGSGESSGEDFDIREFHDHVLENGSVPLPFLRDHIEAWLAGKR